MKESADSESFLATQQCCPPHRWVMANGWHRLADIRYVCAHCGTALTAVPEFQMGQAPLTTAWPTWDDIIADA
ncbi:MAG: hypothetical protein ACYC4L_15015 [Chloroflexota bacterium]